ncbi:glyoxalase superfamily protein [Salinispora arenicola]|uniref:Catechol 2,3-dioxygenase-like lactoylglutathione lyase family enzyme n=2 Tax=Salinispora arenicola TaxID=168697 RepID=A0A542XQW2_SALAC|nr:glyoxalase superfamily protein [Salinispora arenicola]MCN0153298.1 glyoxalase superfamily protein [Salinispora arenicola]MCN0177007.1 glyoxalase superfamily protein [Salinispora arenicola]NIL41305.1 glyoxalase [Salinispora arenicola]NIL55713.1 glyoxalase [Salinispora arenicola]TQL38246.1 catechol 2,3-dioxygenase-like lactoylglutathione lyase family enzyme [Salinispora arenicola]
MNWTFEVVCVPVSDVDRARKFYVDQLGFHLDYDTEQGDNRVIQVTPPGSGCSICFGRGVVDMQPGSMKGMVLVVPDLKAAREELVKRDVTLSEIKVYDRDGSLRAYQEGDGLDKMGFVFFNDPDGNEWSIQQIDDRG